MRTLSHAFRTLFKKGSSNLIKILSLGTGLAIGLVLIAKVCFNTSYESFYPDNDLIYRITVNYIQNGNALDVSRISGGVAVGMQEEVPGIEFGTRMTWFWDNGIFRTPDKKKYKAEMMLVDTNFLKIFPRKILVGDPSVLGQPLQILVSEKLAKTMGGTASVIGQTLINDERPDVLLTIGGVFEDVPENTTIKYDILLSLASYNKESRENWLGNERYEGYVKLLPGVDPNSLKDAIRKMQYNHQNLDELKEKGLEIGFTLKPFNRWHTDSPEIKRMNVLLSLLAFALIFTAVMNYVLIVISSLVNRSKEVGVRKCYGAEGRDIRQIILSETLMHMVISLLLAVAIIFAFKEVISDLLDTAPIALLAPKSIFVGIVVLLLVFLVSGLLPSWMFERIPISSAFRSYKESRKQWKKALLIFQFAASSFLVILLTIIALQYRTMINDDPGYSYKNLLFCDLKGADPSSIQKAMDEVARLPQVQMVGAAKTIPLAAGSGNNIRLPGEDRDLFNICDLYYGSANYVELMGLKLVEGRAPATTTEIVVSSSFLSEMSKFTKWEDGALGKNVIVSEHSMNNTIPFTICGVFEDILIGNRTNDETRAQILFFSDNYKLTSIMLMQLHQLNIGDMMQISRIFENNLPDKDIQVRAYRDEIRLSYDSARRFRSAVLIGGIITLLITLIGMVAYTSNETHRRRKEIAIRKINGGTLKEILQLFIKDILKISLPAFACGAIAAYFMAEKWLEQFSVKISLHIGLFLFPSLLLLFVVSLIVWLNCLSTAKANPVDSLVAE